MMKNFWLINVRQEQHDDDDDEYVNTADLNIYGNL